MPHIRDRLGWGRLWLVLTLLVFAPTARADGGSTGPAADTLATQLRQELVLQGELLQALVEAGPVARPADLDVNDRLFVESRARARINADLIGRTTGGVRAPLDALSDADLAGLGHTVQRAVAGAGGADHLPDPVRQRCTSWLLELGAELDARGQLVPWVASRHAESLARRFELVETVNRTARAEARHLADKSPLLIEDRARMHAAWLEIVEIDQEVMGRHAPRVALRDLLTPETLDLRLEVLRDAEQALEARSHLVHHLDVEVEVHRIAVEKQLAVDEAAVAQRRKGSRPVQRAAGDVPPLDGREWTRWKEREVRQFHKALVVEYQEWRATARWDHRWRPPDPNDLGGAPSSGPRPKPDGPGGTPQWLASQYYEHLPVDPVEAATYRGRLDTWVAEIGRLDPRAIAPDLPPAELLRDDPITVERALGRLLRSVDALEADLARKGSAAATSERMTLDAQRQAIAELASVREQQVARVRSGEGARPPPWEPVLDHHRGHFETEGFAARELTGTTDALERLSATLGPERPPTLDGRLDDLRRSAEVADVAEALGRYDGYAVARSKGAAGSEIEHLESALAGDLRNARVRLARLDFDAEVLGQASTRLEDALRTLPVDSVTARGRWYLAPQDLSQVRKFNATRSPGGVWLTPDGALFQFPQVERATTCFTETQARCPAGFATVDDGDQRLCHPPVPSPSRGHWLLELAPW